MSVEDHRKVFLPLRDRLRQLYHSRTPRAMRFQYAVIVVDLAIIAFFIMTPVLQEEPSFLWLDYSVAALLGADLVIRALASRNIPRWLMQPRIWIDCFILLTLLLPTTLANLGFLRIVRLWLMSRSGFLWRPLEQYGLGFWRDTGRALVNLITFLFVVTGFLYTFFFRKGKGFVDYIDALYFTVATATTTGFGDIVRACRKLWRRPHNGLCRPRSYALLAAGSPKQTDSSRFCSHTVQAPAKPNPFRSHSMASNPRIVRRAVWKD